MPGPSWNVFFPRPSLTHQRNQVNPIALHPPNSTESMGGAQKGSGLKEKMQDTSVPLQSWVATKPCGCFPLWTDQYTPPVIVPPPLLTIQCMRQTKGTGPLPTFTCFLRLVTFHRPTLIHVDLPISQEPTHPTHKLHKGVVFSQHILLREVAGKDNRGAML